MAQSKHQQLAVRMQLMINQIDKYCDKVFTALNLVQVHFYEKKYIRGRPLMSESAIRSMISTYRNGMKVLCPHPKTKLAFQTLPLFGAIVQPPIIIKSNIIDRQTHGWFIPWGVIITLPNNNISSLEQLRNEVLLYGPNKSELSYHIDSFERENASNTFTHQFLTMLEETRQEEVFKKNLAQSPAPLYDAAIQEWLSPNREDNSDVMAQSPQHLYDTDFAPRPDQNIALAYEAVLKSIRSDTFKHRQTLRCIYRDKLEKAMFQELDWPDDRCKARLNAWRDNLFKERLGGKDAPNRVRWGQSNSIDHYTAARFLRYFCTRFLSNHNDEVAGEVACILWILLWCAQDENCEKISIQDVIDLSSEHVNTDSCLQIGRFEVEVPSGVHELLQCLVGNAAKRSRRLFYNIKHRKALERALKDASSTLLKEGAMPVSPGAFLIWPHIFDEVRLTPKQRATARNAPQLVPLRHLRHDMFKALKAAKRS